MARVNDRYSSKQQQITTDHSSSFGTYSWTTGRSVWNSVNVRNRIQQFFGHLLDRYSHFSLKDAPHQRIARTLDFMNAVFYFDESIPFLNVRIEEALEHLHSSELNWTPKEYARRDLIESRFLVMNAFREIVQRNGYARRNIPAASQRCDRKRFFIFRLGAISMQYIQQIFLMDTIMRHRYIYHFGDGSFLNIFSGNIVFLLPTDRGGKMLIETMVGTNFPNADQVIREYCEFCELAL